MITQHAVSANHLIGTDWKGQPGNLEGTYHNVFSRHILHNSQQGEVQVFP